MRKLFTLFSMFMLCLGMSAQTETTLLEAYQIYITGANGQAGSTAELTLNMKNRNLIATWICTLVLPEGISYQGVSLTGEGITPERYPDGYNPTIKGEPNDDGTITITCEGEDGYTLTGYDGAVGVVTVNVDRTLTPGSYELVVKDIKLIEPDGITIHTYGKNEGKIPFTWTIEQGEIVTSTITFIDVDGTILNTITQEVGTTVTPPEDPTKDGYAFVGWDPEIPELMPENDLTITALWAKTYTATFILDETGATETYILKEDDPIPLPDEPDAREGYTFSWVPDVPDTMPAEDLTFTATWTINTHTITFYVDNEEVYSTSVEYGTELATYAERAASQVAVREGYTFQWIDVPETMPDWDVNIQGFFTINTYTVTYIFGENESVVKEVTYGETIPLPTADETPTREGYHFVWEPDPTGYETMPAENLEFVAQWELNTWKITFYVDNEEVYSTNVNYGEELAMIAERAASQVPEREGYTLHWIDLPETMPDWDVTIQAYFTVNIYTATFIFGEGLSVVKEVAYGETIPLPTADETPTRDGYAFVGWDPEVPETMPAYSMEFTALWELLAETITLTQEYMPFSCAESLDFTDSGLKAYIVTEFYKDINYVVLEEIQQVPQYTGVLLYGEITATAAPTYKIPYIAQMPQVDNNLLQPVLQDMWLNPEAEGAALSNYIFDMSSNGFVPLTGNGVEIFAPSAYLQLPTDDIKQGKVVRFGFRAEDPDAITSVQQNDSKNAIFDMQGRRVNKTAKGIYIINGKKFAVK